MCNCLCTYREVIEGNGGLTPLIYNLDIRWSCVISLTSRPLYSKGKALVPIELKDGWSPQPERYISAVKDLIYVHTGTSAYALKKMSLHELQSQNKEPLNILAQLQLPG